MVINRTPS